MTPARWAVSEPERTVKTGRRIAGAAVAVVVVGVTWGNAAGLGGLGASSLGAGASPVVSCDGNGVTVTYIGGGNITAVTVSDIAAGCVGGQMSLTLANTGGASIGAGGPVAVTGGSHNVPVNPQPVASSVAAIHVVIAGP